MALQWEIEETRRPPRSVRTRPWSQQNVEPASAWNSLMRGEWVVAEHSMIGSSRTILALSARSPAVEHALEETEVRIATRRARGESVKAIAFDPSCSEGVVHRHVASVMRKLKLPCQADLVVLLRDQCPWGLCASRIRWSGDDCQIFTYAAPFWPLPRCLTRAEQSIVLELVAGACHRDIAMARGTSERTVANQVASIFRKLNVGSRLDLFVALRPR
jgi:DNA-binding NarL/FixJ family response regulator